ncbi:MAG: ABC transporter permease subunit [Alphaproteobacteria bacterium]|nr:ABC transporter permease subunit [Alphaproteobacteria bacterium]
MTRHGFSQLWGILLLFAGWQIWVAAGAYNAIVLPRPLDVLTDLVTEPAAYLEPTAATVVVAGLGLGLGVLLGTGLAIAAWTSRVLAGMLTPLGLVFSSVPVVCLIPVLARLFGYDERTVLAVVAVITFFPCLVFTAAGLRATPPMTAELFQSLGASRRKLLYHLALPAAIPQMMIALRVTAAQSILAAMVAEFLMGTGGLGNLFAVSHSDFQMSRAFGASLVAMALSTAVYAATASAERRVRQRWS